MDCNNITHPSHYCEGRSYEPIEVISDWELDFDLGNVVKYISRAGRKGNKLENLIEDLEKAAFYLNHAIEKQREIKIIPTYDSYQCGIPSRKIEKIENDKQLQNEY